jgi:hypothetical protein
MAALVVDTHAAVWYLLNSSRLSSIAQRAMGMEARVGPRQHLDLTTQGRLKGIV